MVEVCAAPFWQRVLTVGRFYRGFRLPDDVDFQRLEAWWFAVVNRPSVNATLVCTDRLIAAYSDYAANVATSNYAKGAQASLSNASTTNHPKRIEERMRKDYGDAVAAAKPKVIRFITLLGVFFLAGVAVGKRRRA